MTKSKDNVRLLDDGAVASDNESKPEPNDTQKIMSNLPKIIEAIVIETRLLKIKYDSLIAAGFTEKQAIELCKK